MRRLMLVLTVLALAATLVGASSGSTATTSIKTKTIAVSKSSLRPGVRLTLPRTSRHVHWLRCDRHACRKIRGATHRSYVVRMADVGYRLRAQFSTQQSVTALTAATPMVGRPAPVNTAIPTISDGGEGGGSMAGPIVGDVLTGTDGTWKHAVRFTYQWDDCDSTGVNCVPIAGASTQTYTLQDSDVGDTIVFAVTAYNF